MWQNVLWSDETKCNFWDIILTSTFGTKKDCSLPKQHHTHDESMMVQALIDPYSKILTAVLKAKSVSNHV